MSHLKSLILVNFDENFDVEKWELMADIFIFANDASV